MVFNRNELTVNIKTLSVISFLSGFARGIFSPMYPLFALSIGITMEEIGLITTIATGIASLLLMLFGRLIDKYGRKAGICVAHLLFILASLTLFLAENIFHFILGVTFFNIAIFTLSSSQGSMVTESAPREMVGLSFGVIFAVGGISSIFSPTLGGFISEVLGYRLAMLASALIGIASLIVALLFLKETFKGSEMKVLPEMRELVDFFKPEREILGLYIVSTVDRIAWSLWMPLVQAYLGDHFGATPTQVGLLTSIVMGTWVLMQVPICKLTDKIGEKVVLIFSELAGVASAVGLILLDLSLQPLVCIVLGISIALWVPAFNSIVGIQSTIERRGESYSKITAFRNMFSIPFPYIGGWLYQTVSYFAPFLVSSPILAMNAALMYMLLDKSTKTPKVD